MFVRPVIALTSDVRPAPRPIGFVFESYVTRVEEAGGLPMVIPPLTDKTAIPTVLEHVDGVVIVGGEDLDPALYGEEPLESHDPIPEVRADFDLELGRALLESDHPVLGVCYGCQLLTVVSGGALWQDLPTQVGETVRHMGRWPDLPLHPIEVRPGTRLRELLGADRLEVNSAHHQAPKRLGDGLVVSATAADGTIEAFETPGERFLLGVEWHPDLMGERPEQRRLFEALVEAGRRRRRSR
jgi:putative glutamine amidotransferase